MKKLITLIISIVVCWCSTALLGGCSSSDKPNPPAKVKNGEWIEIQSITYYTNHFNDTYVSNETKLESRCYIDFDQEEISREEYEKAPEEYKIYRSNNESIPINRHEYISELKQQISKIYYSYYYSDAPYRYAIKNFELRYLRVRFLDENCLEINYFESQSYSTIRVLPLSYTITYFND